MAVAAPPVRPRSDWGTDLPPVGPILPEEDVRFLLVHHTDSPNVGPDRSIDQLRSFYGYHTSTKGWPDIAYNFLVDSGGQVWEGRAGSLQGPVRGDATGGSQGHALLCCFIGSFLSEPPTGAAQEAMTALLAWLADTYGVELSEGAQVTFTSRGSNRWPAGAVVTTDPFAGHRDMSQTSCPGDAAYPLVRNVFLPGARALVAAGRPAPTPTPAPTTPAPAALTVTPSATATTSLRAAAPAAVERPGMGLAEAAVAAAGLGATAALAVVLRRRMTMPAGRHGRR